MRTDAWPLGALALLAACGGPASPREAPIAAVDVPPMPPSSGSAQPESPPPNAEPYLKPEPTEPEVASAAGPARPSLPGVASFDKGAAATALASAQLSRCQLPGGPTGPGHVTVTFDPNGTVSSASVDAGAFPGTPTGGCIAKVFSTITVPPFSGAPVRVGKSFHVP